MGSDGSAILATLGLYAIAVMSPGPNFALISRLSLSGSVWAAIGATLGLAFAATFYAILTMTGLSLLLTRVGWLASMIQIGGGCYLIYLGIKAWLSAVPPAKEVHATSSFGTALAGFRTGTIVNLSNPKVIAFFVGLYAVAVPADLAFLSKLSILIGGFVLELLWYGAVIALLSTQPARDAYHRFGRWIERAVGTALAAFGIRLISEKL